MAYGLVKNVRYYMNDMRFVEFVKYEMIDMRRFGLKHQIRDEWHGL
jgi:hypothetical protein